MSDSLRNIIIDDHVELCTSRLLFSHRHNVSMGWRFLSRNEFKRLTGIFAVYFRVLCQWNFVHLKLSCCLLHAIRYDLLVIREFAGLRNGKKRSVRHHNDVDGLDRHSTVQCDCTEAICSQMKTKKNIVLLIKCVRQPVYVCDGS